jgi:DNA-directed RNA polymerase subunit RPC12/RpoP
MHQHPTRGAKVEVAEVFHRFGGAYREKNTLADQVDRVLGDLVRCRTASLGEHLYTCQDCGSEVPLYNSCLNRHCPTCQGPAQYHWIAQRQRRLLNTGYFHMVFTLPAVLRPVVLAHPRLLLTLLFSVVAQTLNAFAADPKRLGAQIGFTLVLHTWRRDMLFHPHIHVIVTGGGLTADGSRWISLPDEDFLFPAPAVSKLFRGKFLHGLIELSKAGKLGLTEQHSRKLVREAKRQDWVVFAKKPFGGPAQIVNYLGRYTHRVAISSARMISITEDHIVFRTRGEKTCSLTPEEFIRRFLLHVLPHQFFKIRHYGLLAPGNVNTRLARAQEILGPPPEDDDPPPNTCARGGDDTASSQIAGEVKQKTTAERSAPRCPHCGGRLVPLMRRNLRLDELPPPDT